MSRFAEQAVETSSTRTRQRSPEPFDRNVRQRIELPAPSADRATRDAAVEEGRLRGVSRRDIATAVKQEEAIEPSMNEIFGDRVWMKDQEFDTAITHVILDHPEHPMYQRHLDYILREMCTHAFGAPITSKPLLALHCVDAHRAQASDEKRRAAKQLLTERWLRRILQHVGEVMEATDQEGVAVYHGTVSGLTAAHGAVTEQIWCGPNNHCN